MSVTSVASYLPNSTMHDNATFAGVSAAPPSKAPALTPVQEAALREHQTALQLADAEARNVAWAAEDDTGEDPDAEGEDDEEYERQPNGEYLRVRILGGPTCFGKPIGLRTEDRKIVPMPVGYVATSSNAASAAAVTAVPDDVGDIIQAHFSGLQETVPKTVGELVKVVSLLTLKSSHSSQRKDQLPFDILEQTQQLGLTQQVEPQPSTPQAQRHSLLGDVPSSATVLNASTPPGILSRTTPRQAPNHGRLSPPTNASQSPLTTLNSPGLEVGSLARKMSSISDTEMLGMSQYLLHVDVAICI